MNPIDLALPLATLEQQARRRSPAPHRGQDAARGLRSAALVQPVLPHHVRGTDEWLGGLVMGLPLGVVVVDRHYDIQAINGVALRLFGIYTAPLGEDLIHLTQSVPTTALRAAIDGAFQEMSSEPRAAGAAEVAGPVAAEAVVTVETILGERRHLRIACYPYALRAPQTPPREHKEHGQAPVRAQGTTGTEAETGAVSADGATSETGETAVRTAEVAFVLILVEDVTAQIEEQHQAAAQVERARGEQEARQTYERGESAQPLERIEAENARLRQETDRVTAINRSLLEANQNLNETTLRLRRAYDEMLVDQEEAEANAEEVKTLNEELQSTNEEYVTVNEELDATVEVLRVANNELQARASELQQSAETLAAQRTVSEAARAQLEAILASLRTAVLVVDQAGTPLLTNAAYAAMFGGEHAVFWAEDEAGHPLPTEATPQQRAARGETFTMEFTLTSADGACRYFETSGEPIRSVGEELGGVLAIRDITERTLQRRLQDEFVSLASHELRTPLTPLTSYLEMLSRLMADRPEDDRARIYTTRAQHQAQRLERLTQDLLDVNRLQSGKLHLTMGPVRLDEVVARTSEAAQTMAEDQTIHVERASDTPLLVNGDPFRLEQVFTNLLTNAITHAPQSQRIDVRVGRVGDEAEVQVQDYGPGIPAKDQPYIFSRFYQVMRADGQQPSRRGLGLGLYIAHEVVAMHGGRIEVASVEAPRTGHGTTFTVRLPLAPPEQLSTPRKDRCHI